MPARRIILCSDRDSGHHGVGVATVTADSVVVIIVDKSSGTWSYAKFDDVKSVGKYKKLYPAQKHEIRNIHIC